MDEAIEVGASMRALRAVALTSRIGNGAKLEVSERV